MGRRVGDLLDRFIFADELSLDARRINIMLLFGLCVAVGCTILRLVEQAPMSSLIVQAIFIGSVIIAALVVNIYKIYTFAIYVMVVSLNFILFPLAFFFNGGLLTGMPAFFSMGIALIVLLTGGRQSGLLIAINIVWVIACYVVANQYPHIIQTPASPILSTIDHIGSFLMVGMFIGAVIRVQDHLYVRERAKVMDVTEGLLYRDRLRVDVNELAAALLNARVDDFEAVFDRYVGQLAIHSDIDRAIVWRNAEKDGKLHYITSYCWASKAELKYVNETFSYDETPGWYQTLANDGIISGPVAGMDPETQKTLTPYGIRSVLVVPAVYQNQFEGFVSFDDCHRERDFSQDEIEILRSATLILTNATIRSEIMDSLVAAREEALAGNRAKSEFLSNMSHEMRTPMNAITGMIAIAKGTDSVDRKNECLDKMEEASIHLLGVISDVLDMSKIEANKLELSLSDFSFSRLIERVVTVSTFQTQEKGLDFELDLDPRVPDALRGDDQRVSQVITNILANAIKFTPEGGTVTLRTRLLEPSALPFDSEALALPFGSEPLPPDSHLVGITIADSGIGISAEQMDRLFKPFQQAESTTSRRFGGTGLGLAISERIVKQMGGTILVESELGVGSSFEIVIPLADAQSDVCLTEPKVSLRWEKPGDVNLADHCILLAEDIEVNREIVIAFVEPTGIGIDCAPNGVEATRLFEQDPRRYDLILMDMQMPEMDGCDATRHIRSLDVPWAKEIPIIALTANVFKDDIDKCLAAGMNDHLGKPLDQDKVIEVIRTYLDPST
jgi:signal transduction histidine kinase/CheY-like chemotaxis protein